MSANSTIQTPSRLMHLGDIRWVRGHISTFCIGAVLLVCADLLTGGSEMWAFTAIGIWIMLLVVHLVIVLISRLSIELMADDDEEVVLLPIKEAQLVEPKSDPETTWNEPDSRTDEQPADSPDKVSWSVATDLAQAKRSLKQDKPNES